MSAEDQPASAPRFAPVETPLREGHALARVFGTEERLRAAGSQEIAALGSSTLVVDFLKSKVEELAKEAAGRALQWATAELLKAFGIGSPPNDLEEVKSLLSQILTLQEEMLQKLDAVLLEVQFQHVVTRGYEAVQRIVNVYESLQRLSKIVNPAEREREAQRLQAGILDVNSGILVSLKTVSDVLTGKDQLGRSDPLIKLFAARWYNAYHPKQLRDDVPLSTYFTALDEYLRELSIIQYMGVSALANARIANGDYEALAGEMEVVIGRLEEQQKLLDNEIPAWVRTLPRELLDEGNGTWFNVHVYGVFGGPDDATALIYAPHYEPQVPILKQEPNRVRFGELASKMPPPLAWFTRNQQWKLVKADAAKSALEADAFYLCVRELEFYVTRDIDSFDRQTLRMDFEKKDSLRAKMRLVMGQPSDPGKRSTARPVLGFVGRDDYLTVGKVLDVQWVARGGPEDKALGIHVKKARLDLA